MAASSKKKYFRIVELILLMVVIHIPEILFCQVDSSLQTDYWARGKIYSYKVVYRDSLGNIISDEEQQKIRDGTHVHISDDAMPKLTFRAPQGFDLRRQINRQWVEQVRHDVAVLWEQSQSIDRNITYLARLLWHYDQAKEQYSQFQAMLKDYWANPHRVWTEIEDVRNPRTGDYEQREMTYQWKDNAELIIEDNISRHDRAMQWAIEQHENQLELMAQSSPKCDRISFRHQLIGETERRKNDKKLICQWESDFRA